MIVEYKMDRDHSGVLVVPPWVECPGFLQDPSNKTFIGFSPAVREYKIPETVTKLTVQQAKDRALAIHALYPMKTAEGVTLTETQVNELVQAIIDANDIV
jgi:hypothetical protein